MKRVVIWLFGCFRIKTCSQFVKKHKLRLWNQCQHDKKPLTFDTR